MSAAGDGLGNKVDVDFGLATGGYAMEETDGMCLPLLLDLRQSEGLGGGKGWKHKFIPDFSCLSGLLDVKLGGFPEGGQCRLEDFADGTEVIIGHPLPELQLLGEDDGCGIDKVDDVLDFNVGACFVVQAHDESDGTFLIAEWHGDTAPCLCLGCQVFGQGVSEKARKRYGQHYVGEAGHGGLEIVIHSNSPLLVLHVIELVLHFINNISAFGDGEVPAETNLYMVE